MRNRGAISYGLLIGLILIFAGILLAQSPLERTLVVNGKTAGSVALLVGDRWYVDVETVAQFTNGAVTLEPSRVVLTFPEAAASAAAPPAPPPAPPPTPPAGLSREFARLAVAELAEMREWRGAVGTILTYGVPVVGTWPQDYRDRAEADLNQVSVAAATEADQQAFVLLQNEFASLDRWSSNVVATRNALNATQTVNPNVMQNDQALTKISNCARFLGSMLVGGSFADDPSCH